MRANFPASLAAVLVHEGGYVDDKLDPGGATNFGVTQQVYDDWRHSHELPSQSVRNISEIEVEALYLHRYWNACHCDELPSGVDYCIFDFAVNSGTGRASRYLQRAAGVAEDGAIGPATLAAVSTKTVLEIINSISDARQDFLERLPTFPRFGRGWTARVAEVATRAKEMAA